MRLPNAPLTSSVITCHGSSPITSTTMPLTSSASARLNSGSTPRSSQRGSSLLELMALPTRRVPLLRAGISAFEAAVRCSCVDARCADGLCRSRVAHQATQRALGACVDRQLAADAAAVHHQHAVGQREDLVELR